jgi:hypothetical protein
MASLAASAHTFKHQLDAWVPVRQLLDALEVGAVCRAAGHRWRNGFWTPAVTLLTFLRQVLAGNCSCRQAVATTLAQSVAGDAGHDRGRPGWISGDPSAYSQARHRLPSAALERLNRRAIERARAFLPSIRTWCGRCVVIVDGSSVQAPDTPALQKAFPQPSGQKPGCGFPVLRLVGMFCWASGCLLNLVSGSLHTSELVMFRTMLDALTPGTVVLGDRYYGSYYDLHRLMQRGLDGVFRLSGARSGRLRRRKRRGPCDQLVTWMRPPRPPRGLAAEAWAMVPASLTLRQVWFEVKIAGFRSRRIELVTTLTDAASFPREKLAELYRDRWQVELNLRHLKTTLKMEVLRCQSVEMVRKELAIYQLAYNLIRLLMGQAAETHGRDPHRLSFAGTRQRLEAMWPYLDLCRTPLQRCQLAQRLLEQIAADPLPDRPHRLEPRAVKRRPKNYRRLTRPRHQARRMAYFING